MVVYITDTVDGRIFAPVQVGSFSHYLQCFIHPRWLAGFLPSTVSLMITLFWMVEDEINRISLFRENLTFFKGMTH